jgi:ATP-dependent Lhr-like helicase
VVEGADAEGWLLELAAARRAARVRMAGEERWIAADDAGSYRDALGVVPPSGLPEVFLADGPDALGGSSPATPPPTARSPRRGAGALPRRPGRGPARARARRHARRGELRPGGSEREWCDTDVLRRLRRASLAVLRKEIEAVDQRALAQFLPSWQGVDRHPAGGRRGRPAARGPRPAPGLALPIEVWERDVLPRRCGAYSPTWLDALCSSGEVVWVGAGALGRASGRVALYFRDDAPVLGPPPGGRAELAEVPEHETIRERLRRSPCFFTDLLAELPTAPEVLQEALWDLVWAGEVTNDAWAPLRSPRQTLARAKPAGGAARAGRRFGGARRAAPTVQGRWSLTSSLFLPEPDPGLRRRTQAELLLERYGIVTREQVLAEGIPGGFSILYDALSSLETLGVCRRGYFVEGLGGAQFALPGAVERLRAQQASEEAPPVVLAATDPAQPYGAALPWPKRGGSGRGAAAARPQPAPVAGGRRARRARRGRARRLRREGRARAADARRPGRPAARAPRSRRSRLRPGRPRRKLALEKIDGEPVVGSELEPLLIELGLPAGAAEAHAERLAPAPADPPSASRTSSRSCS